VAIEIRSVCTLLQVFDMPSSTAFYRDVLGFSVVATSPPGPMFHWALLRQGKADIMLNTLYDDGQRPETPEVERVAHHADTVLYFSCPDVDAAYEQLRVRGVAAEPPVVTSYGMKQLYFNDPDGYALCLQWPVREAVL
jgi:glyoxylase I family protein